MTFKYQEGEHNHLTATINQNAYTDNKGFQIVRSDITISATWFAHHPWSFSVILSLNSVILTKHKESKQVNFLQRFWEDEQSNSSPLGGATIKEINLPSITDTIVFIRKFESKVLAKYVITENPLHGFISIPKKENVPLNELYLLCNY